MPSQQVVPLDLDAVNTVRTGTAVWLVALLALLPFHDRLGADGHTWWLWTCATGVGLGVAGMLVTTRRRARRTSYAG